MEFESYHKCLIIIVNACLIVNALNNERHLSDIYAIAPYKFVYSCYCDLGIKFNSIQFFFFSLYSFSVLSCFFPLSTLSSILHLFKCTFTIFTFFVIVVNYRLLALLWLSSWFKLCKSHPPIVSGRGGASSCNVKNWR